MATSPSEPDRPAAGAVEAVPVEIVGGGPASEQEVTAIVAALAALSADEGEARASVPSPWRWSGRRWLARTRGGWRLGR